MDIMWYDVIWCDITSGSQPRHHQFSDDWYEIIWVANTCYVPQCYWLMLVNNSSIYIYNQHHIIASTSTCWWVPCLKQFCQKFAFLIHVFHLWQMYMDVMMSFCSVNRSERYHALSQELDNTEESTQFSACSNCFSQTLKMAVIKGFPLMESHGFSAKQDQGSNQYINEEWGNPIGSPKLSDSPLVGYSNAALCAAKPSTLQGLRG